MFLPGLMAAVLGRGAQGKAVPKCGVMAVVLAGSEIKPGDAIRLKLPPEPHRPLDKV